MDEFRRGSSTIRNPILFWSLFALCVVFLIGAGVYTYFWRKKKQALYSNPIVVSSHTHEPIGNQQTTHQVPIQINRNDTVDVNSKADSQMPSFQQNAAIPMPMPIPMPQMNFQNLQHTGNSGTAPYPTMGSYNPPYPIYPQQNMGNVSSEESSQSHGNANSSSHPQVIGWNSRGTQSELNSKVS
ncbi:CLUMA_CG005348, isoform A [Clunio marinus]|uniref:CLUMA_CG005348, isoform A n=1 Tax=Clunio marinus TaxID=568069 RepID=A0A1J1HUL2_9DIPT|nr:CLUMA_CG005348, isoform A [Clunio marinus]